MVDRLISVRPYPGTPVQQEFEISNSGTGDLELGSISLPSGFSLVSTFSDTVLSYGETATLTVQLDATVGGTFSGSISFVNNDSDENPFDILVSDR